MKRLIASLLLAFALLTTGTVVTQHMVGTAVAGEAGD